MTAYDTLILAESGLVAYYKLDETSGTSAADASTNANAGTYTGTFTLAQAAKDATLLGTAVSFTNGYVTAPSIAATNITGNLTLECWVYPTSHGNYYWLVNKTTGNGGTTSAYEWRLENSTGIPNLLCGGGGAVSAAAAPTLNQWSHVAVTISGSTVTHYLNGAANGTGTLGGSRATTTAPLYIGQRDDLFNGFTGRLDAVAIYNVAKTQAELQAHLAGFSGGNLRLTQAVAEVLTTGTPNLRLTQAVAEVLTTGTPKARATQVALEVLAAGTPNARATQLALEVLLPVGSDICYQNLVLGHASLAAYYKLDEVAGTTLADSKPSGHNGTYTNAPTLGVTSGVDLGLGTAVTFNGSSQYASVPTDASNALSGTACSVECWAKLASVGSNTFNRLVSKGPNVNGAPYINYGFVANDGSGKVGFYWTNSGNTQYNATWATTPATGTWYHLVATYDGVGTIKLYVNGALVATANVTGTLVTSTQPFMIGAAQRGSVVQEYFNGSLNDVALYTAELDAATVAQHYIARVVACVAVTARAQAFFIG